VGGSAWAPNRESWLPTRPGPGDPGQLEPPARPWCPSLDLFVPIGHRSDSGSGSRNPPATAATCNAEQPRWGKAVAADWGSAASALFVTRRRLPRSRKRSCSSYPPRGGVGLPRHIRRVRAVHRPGGPGHAGRGRHLGGLSPPPAHCRSAPPLPRTPPPGRPGAGRRTLRRPAGIPMRPRWSAPRARVEKSGYLKGDLRPDHRWRPLPAVSDSRRQLLVCGQLVAAPTDWARPSPGPGP